MGKETALYVEGLVPANPLGSDSISVGDDHIRMIKTVLKNSFPNITTATTPIVKITRLEDTSTASIRSSSMTDAATFSVAKTSATSNLLIQANLYAGLWTYGTAQTGEAQVYNATAASVIGTAAWDVGGEWNNLGASASANNDVRAWTAMTVMDSTPLAVGTHSIKIRALCSDPSGGGISCSSSTLTVWEIEQ